jgi:hypothetical protein
VVRVKHIVGTLWGEGGGGGEGVLLINMDTSVTTTMSLMNALRIGRCFGVGWDDSGPLLWLSW